MMLDLPDSLPAALQRYDLSVSDAQRARLEQYCHLLWQWNQQLNLTRHTDYDRFVSRDLLDCLALAGLLQKGERVLDVGSGGGVPGVVLAILRADLQLTLAESVQKKARALQSIVSELHLPLDVVAERAEQILARQKFDTLVARAVGPLWKMLKWFAPHWGSIGRVLAIKGPRWVEERGEARHRGYLRPLELRRVAEYAIPSGGARSVILQITAKSRARDG
jgi:16S rRNA (guanine527-N7)-methyltransferase